jgi:hypothetical protein
MKFLEYADLFAHAPAELACLSTFNFDPEFFEQRLLRTDALGQARRILILMDAGQWQKLMTEDVPARWMNRRYLVVPIRRKDGVFHPKLNLLVHAGGAALHCGSANLTRAGCSQNLELLNTITVSFEDHHPSSEDLTAMRSAFGFFRSAVREGPEEAARIADEWLSETGKSHEWLSQTPSPNSEAKVQLVHSYRGGLWQQTVASFAKHHPTRVSVISPFYDKDAEMFMRIRSAWPKCMIEVTAQEGTSSLPVAVLKPLRSHIALFGISTASRRLHAKLIVFEGEFGAVALVGSANFTAAALDGRNIETCLIIRDCQGLTKELFDGQLARKPIILDDFASGSDTEPQAGGANAGMVELKEAVLLSEDKLRLSYCHRLTQRPGGLVATVRCASETRPRASLPIPNRQEGTATVALPKGILADAHGSLLASVAADTEAGRVESRFLWVIQEHKLTYEPSGGRASDDKRIVEETGQGLPEYIEELGRSQGMAAVIDYLNRLNIRFFDGSGGLTLGRPFRVQPHDPFQADVRPDWLLLNGQPGADLKAAIYDFADRHERSRLLRHVSHGNINGMENFLDVFTAMVRLLYVYFRRGVVEKGQVIGRACRYVEIATGGYEDSEYVYPGYLSSLSENLSGDKNLLRKVCRELNYAGFVQGAFLAVQMIRYDPNEVVRYGPQPGRVRECLPMSFQAMTKAFLAAEVPLANKDEVLKALTDYRMMSPEELAVCSREL